MKTIKVSKENILIQQIVPFIEDVKEIEARKSGKINIFLLVDYKNRKPLQVKVYSKSVKNYINSIEKENIQ